MLVINGFFLWIHINESYINVQIILLYIIRYYINLKLFETSFSKQIWKQCCETKFMFLIMKFFKKSVEFLKVKMNIPFLI